MKLTTTVFTMIGLKIFRDFALLFKEAGEDSHFNKTFFEIKEKMVATLDVTKNQCVVKFSLIDQSDFADLNEGVIYTAYCTVALQTRFKYFSSPP